MPGIRTSVNTSAGNGSLSSAASAASALSNACTVRPASRSAWVSTKRTARSSSTTNTRLRSGSVIGVLRSVLCRQQQGEYGVPRARAVAQAAAMFPCPLDRKRQAEATALGTANDQRQEENGKASGRERVGSYG